MSPISRPIPSFLAVRHSRSARRRILSVAFGALLAGLGTAPPLDAREVVTITYSTTPAGGEYAPRHIHAVWVEDSSGRLVRTLARWARKRAKHLTAWKAADGTDVDGVTGATRKRHGAREVTWNLRDRDGRPVPDGVYRIRLELTDDNAKKRKFHRTSIAFEKDGASRRREIGSRDGFDDIVLDYRVSPDTAPRLGAVRVSELRSDAITLAGTLEDTGGIDPQVSIHWGLRDGGTDEEGWQHTTRLGKRAEGGFSRELASLTEGARYFARVSAVNRIGRTWSDRPIEFCPVDPVAWIDIGAPWRYRDGVEAPPESWTAVAFRDADWREGRSGLGYGDGDDATELRGMRGEFITLYMRRAFSVADPERVEALALAIDYDDGFVAYLNGHEVARRNVPEGQDHRTSAKDSREAGEPETVQLTKHLELLKEGANVLALEVHNKGIDSSDLSILPRLLAWISPADEGEVSSPAARNVKRGGG